ncbi:MAG: lysine--tRNA ligase [Alphaproteobacteria bacterium]|nr:lysine--tRNA ligase [Alphaproteobacteria bacterium]
MQESGNDERSMRLQKIQALKAEGIIPYVGLFKKTHYADDIASMDNSLFRSAEDVLANPKQPIHFAGRVMTLRDHGGIIFIDVQDMTGNVQVALTENTIKEKGMAFVRSYIDVGDFIGVTGEPFLTKQNKLALHSTTPTLLSKTLRPIPSKHFGIEDTELTYRRRYLETITDEKAKKRFEIRSAFVQGMREWLLSNKFTEVTTRTLQPIAGGTMAEKFSTHHNAFKHDFYLRISNELDLKRAVVGGFDRVFEFAIDFRNEGIDPSHLQEFQMLEWYCAYDNYISGMHMTEQLLRHAIQKSLGGLTAIMYDKTGEAHNVDFAKEIPRTTFNELLLQEGINIHSTLEELQKKARLIGIEESQVNTRSRANLLDDIYKKTARPKIIKPTFVIDYPADLLPLARKKDDDNSVAESYQLVVAGWEVVKGYSELVDPHAQYQAFLDQEKAKQKGDSEAMSFDDDYIIAMEYGMPPLSGCGIGIERMVALLTGQSNVRDVVLFPLLLPKDESDSIIY